MAIGRGNSEGWGLRPRPTWFCLTPFSHDGKNFLTPSLSLRALQSPAPLRKTLFLINLSITITIVFNKIYFVSKNILEITTKFIPSNQTNF